MVIAARNPSKAAAAVKEVQSAPSAGDRVETIPIDLASFESVHAFADTFNQQHDRLDILLNNAGLVLAKRTVTVDGNESQFQINHLSHFLLTNLLHDKLVGSAPGPSGQRRRRARTSRRVTASTSTISNGNTALPLVPRRTRARS